MIINLLIVLLILILLCNISIYSIRNTCPKNNIQIKYVRASKLSDTQTSKFINIKLDRDVPCGVYELKTAYGEGIMFVPKLNSRTGYLNVKDMNNIMNVTLFDLWNINRINSDDQIVSMYNIGCCT
jgi:hypothetical protein